MAAFETKNVHIGSCQLVHSTAAVAATRSMLVICKEASKP